MVKRIYAKFTHPNAGYNSDIEECEKYLIVGETYKVHYIDMGGFYTYINLLDKNGNIISCENGLPINFNSVNFEFYIKKGNLYTEYDIFSDPDINPYLEDKEGLDYEDSEADQIKGVVEELRDSTLNQKDLIGATILNIDINNPQYQDQIIVEKEGIIYQLCAGNGKIILSKVNREEW